MKLIQIDVELLRSDLRYNPRTGLFMRNRLFRGRHKDGWFPGSMGNTGYFQIMVRKKLMQAHRIAWAIHFGEWPDGFLDHKNGNRGDNRICNLRIASCAENCRNSKVSKSNRSGVLGVGIDPSNGKWRARIWIDGKSVFLGHFKNCEDAAKARKAADRRYGFSKNHGRKS